MAAGSNQRKTTDPLIKLHSVRKLLATFSGYWLKVCNFPRLAEPDFLLRAADSVAHRKAVQRFATASPRLNRTEPPPTDRTPVYKFYSEVAQVQLLLRFG
jgi:hypothetical protein